MPFNASISLIGALTALAITVVLARVAFPAERRGLREAWLLAWGGMTVHFGFQVAQRAGWGLPVTSWIADGLLVAAIWLFVDWEFFLSAREGLESPAFYPYLGWCARAFALGLLIWALVFPDWRDTAQTVAFGVLPVAGGLALFALRLGSRLTRTILGLGLVVWGLAFLLAPWSWAGWASVENGALVDVGTLICKVLCGVAMVLFVVDDQRKLAEERRDYLADLYHNSPLWYHSVDEKGVITDINAVAQEFLGLDARRVIGHVIRDFAVPGSYDALPSRLEIMDELRRSGRYDGLEMQLRNAAGEARAMRFFGRAVRDERGEMTGARILVWDVTAEKRLQGQLVQAQKMEAVGTLTAGVAHDFNNLLTSILGQTELIEAKFSAALPGDAAERVRAIGAAGKRAAELVAQLLAFSRRQPVEMRRLELNETLRQACDILRHGLPETIALEVALPEEEHWIEGNPTQLQQVILNLGVNARQAMPGGGRLRVGLEEREDFQPPEKARGDWAALSVSDDGCGMEERVRARIFEPFFTTKGTGQGTGLGLAMVYGIVEGHGGTIAVESAPGAGATFRIFLPLIPAAKGVAAGVEVRS